MGADGKKEGDEQAVRVAATRTGRSDFMMLQKQQLIP